MISKNSLWTLIYQIVQPKNNETPNECLKRLVNERDGVSSMRIDSETSDVSQASWTIERLAELDAKHCRINEYDDSRPIIVVDLEGRMLLVDGNHRVAKTLKNGFPGERKVIVITPKENAYTNKFGHKQ